MYRSTCIGTRFLAKTKFIKQKKNSINDTQDSDSHCTSMSRRQSVCALESQNWNLIGSALVQFSTKRTYVCIQLCVSPLYQLLFHHHHMVCIEFVHILPDKIHSHNLHILNHWSSVQEDNLLWKTTIWFLHDSISMTYVSKSPGIVWPMSLDNAKNILQV